MAGADFRRPSDSGPVEGGKRTAGPVVLGLSDIARARRGGWWVDFDDLTRGRVIGEGRFAIVEHCTLRRERAPEALNVAVKFLKPNLLNSPRDLQDFVNEARLLRKIRHPHIVEFIGVGKVDGGGPGQPVRAVYIVHEFMAGGSLKATLVKQMKRPRKAVYSYADALTWLTQIASGLAYLHASTPRVIHRDVKPENVLLTRDARSGRLVAKLADFGLHALVKDSKPGKEGDTQAAVFSRASYASAVSMVSVGRCWWRSERWVGRHLIVCIGATLWPPFLLRPADAFVILTPGLGVKMRYFSQQRDSWTRMTDGSG